jgi:hypothetical protein
MECTKRQEKDKAGKGRGREKSREEMMQVKNDNY